MMTQLPPINWLAASGRIDSGLHGLVRAEAQDEQGAQNLRDVVQGFLALARMQGAREPAYKGMLDSVALSRRRQVGLAVVRGDARGARRAHPVWHVRGGGRLAAPASLSQFIFFYGTLMTPFNRPGASPDRLASRVQRARPHRRRALRSRHLSCRRSRRTTTTPRARRGVRDDRRRRRSSRCSTRSRATAPKQPGNQPLHPARHPGDA